MEGRGLGKIPNHLTMVHLEMCDVDVMARHVEKFMEHCKTRRNESVNVATNAWHHYCSFISIN